MHGNTLITTHTTLHNKLHQESQQPRFVLQMCNTPAKKWKWRPPLNPRRRRHNSSTGSQSSVKASPAPGMQRCSCTWNKSIELPIGDTISGNTPQSPSRRRRRLQGTNLLFMFHIRVSSCKVWEREGGTEQRRMCYTRMAPISHFVVARGGVSPANRVKVHSPATFLSFTN